MEAIMQKITDWAAYHSMEPVFNGCIKYFDTVDKEMQDRVFKTLKCRFGFYVAYNVLNSLSSESETTLLFEAIKNIINDAGLNSKHLEIHTDILQELNLFRNQCRQDNFEPSANVRSSLKSSKTKQFRLYWIGNY